LPLLNPSYKAVREGGRGRDFEEGGGLREGDVNGVREGEGREAFKIKGEDLLEVSRGTEG
jgi:hypothetical protein